MGVISLPVDLDIKELVDQVDQDSMVRMIGEVKDQESRESLMSIYNVILALWVYWSITKDETAAYHISYYQDRFFDLYFRSKGEVRE